MALPSARTRFTRLGFDYGLRPSLKMTLGECLLAGARSVSESRTTFIGERTKPRFLLLQKHE